jgi:hypothetical protein
MSRGLRPVPVHTMLSHCFGVSYLYEGDYSWWGAASIMLYMLLGIAALLVASGTAEAWWDGLRVAWAVATGPKPPTRRVLRRRYLSRTPNWVPPSHVPPGVVMGANKPSAHAAV